MSLAADHLVANIVHESSLYRSLRLQRPGEQGREDAELGGEEGQMLTNEDLSMRYPVPAVRGWWWWWRLSLSAIMALLHLCFACFIAAALVANGSCCSSRSESVPWVQMVLASVFLLLYVAVFAVCWSSALRCAWFVSDPSIVGCV